MVDVPLWLNVCIGHVRDNRVHSTDTVWSFNSTMSYIVFDKNLRFEARLKEITATQTDKYDSMMMSIEKS